MFTGAGYSNCTVTVVAVQLLCSPFVSSIDDDVSWLHVLKQLINGGVDGGTGLNQHDHTPAGTQGDRQDTTGRRAF